MAATNVQAFSGDVEISSNVTAANSKFSLDTNGTFKQDANENGRYIKLMKYFASASNWKIATGSYAVSGFQWLSIRAKMTRLDVDVEIIQFNYYGSGGISRVRDPIVIGGGGSSTQANEIKVYNKTADSTYEIYLQIDSATTVEVEISHRGSTIDDDYSTVAAGAIDETGLTKIYDSGTTTDLRLKTGKVGINAADPYYAIDMIATDDASGHIRITQTTTEKRAGLYMVNPYGKTFTIECRGQEIFSTNAAVIENFADVNGGIDFYAKGDGAYRFYTTNSNTQRMLIANDGKVTMGKAGLNTDAGNEALRAINSNYPAAFFESGHSLGLVSVVKAKPNNGAYNNSGDYNNNAVYRSDIDAGYSSEWKHFSGINGGTLTFYVKKDGYTRGQHFANAGFDFYLGNGDQTTRGDSGASRAFVKHTGSPGPRLYINYAADFEGGVHVESSFSKNSGSFKIDHPLPEKENTHDLVHSFIEGPQADNIYRGVVQLTDGVSTVNLDEASRMTEGTFVALNRRTQCFTTNEKDWDAVKGTLNGNILEIECQNTSSTTTVSWLVIGERQDKHMFETKWTDDEGRIITEPLKDFEYYDTDYVHALRDISEN